MSLTPAQAAVLSQDEMDALSLIGMSSTETHAQKLKAVFQGMQNFSDKHTTLGNLLKNEGCPYALSGGVITVKTFEPLPIAYGSFRLSLCKREGDVYSIQDDWAEVSFYAHNGQEGYHLAIDGNAETFSTVDELQESVRAHFKAELDPS